jgi:G3E family GTPase
MNRRLPVTLIGGFLGAGKTSLLHHFISEHQGGYLAVLVEEGGAPNLDAKALRGLCGTMGRLHDRVLEIPAGEESVQVEWLADTLRDLVDDGRFERVLIEVGGTMNPARLARRFGMGPDLPEAFATWAELQQSICVVDVLDFYRSIVSSSNRIQSSALSDFQQSQIAGASLMVLNKCDLVGSAERDACVRRLHEINPGAHWIETAYGELPREVWSRRATPEQLGAGHQKDAVTASVDPAPELERVLYRAYRPFHPARFWDWFNADHRGLLRVKGLVWLATRNLLVGGISRTRWQNSCGGAGIWWAALPREEWPADPAVLARMQETWREPYGDRRQELVLLGEAAGVRESVRLLEKCLLTPDEAARPVKEWLTWADPFPAWDVGEEG